MNGRHALSIAIVVLGAVLFLADKVVGDGPFSFPPGARLALPPMSPTSPTAALTLEFTPTPSHAELERAERTSRETRGLAASRAEGVPVDEFWSDLAGFSGKSNQERERYVAEYLFPKAGLTEVRKQSVPYGGPWGLEYGNWDGLSNVIAVREGVLSPDNKKRIVLGAHFDKVTYPGRSRNPGTSDGILDNASGVNTVAKIVQSLQNPLNDIEVVAFATEEPEPSFLGSRIYFGKMPDEKSILFFANFDCMGIGNLALIKGAAEPSLAELASNVAENQGIPLVWRAAGKEVVSDHVVAQYFGFKVLSFTSDGYDWRNTHVPEDNLSMLGKENYYRHYLLSLKIIAYLDAYLAEISPQP